jgi:hypothetical protein
MPAYHIYWFDKGDRIVRTESLTAAPMIAVHHVWHLISAEPSAAERSVCW